MEMKAVVLPQGKATPKIASKSPEARRQETRHATHGMWTGAWNTFSITNPEKEPTRQHLGLGLPGSRLQDSPFLSPKPPSL